MAITTMHEPDVRVRERSISYDWAIKTDEFGGESRTHVACLTVSYSAGGVNYFQGTVNNPRCYRATLTREAELGRPNGMSARSYALFQGLRVISSDPVGRFSKKRLEDFARVALDCVRARREEPAIAAFFDPDTY